MTVVEKRKFLANLKFQEAPRSMGRSHLQGSKGVRYFKIRQEMTNIETKLTDDEINVMYNQHWQSIIDGLQEEIEQCKNMIALNAK